MTAKEYLYQIWDLDREITDKQEELDYLRSKAEGCHPAEATGMPRGNDSQDRISDIVIRIVDLQMYINARIDQLIDLKAQVVKQIDAVPDPDQRRILRRRYVLNERWEDIADSMGYTERWCYILHGKALLSFERIHGKELHLKTHRKRKR